ncbi:MAG: ribose-5-phosphate isomerase [spirochete symbiont of Stewartia floridana]|nr:MAG: ribose-5-phosphate isomerase [spirochete symbiont of Stewartia floridana]
MEINLKDNVRRVAIGSDHGALDEKNAIIPYLETLGYVVKDLGCHGPEKVDYPDIAEAVCRKVISGDCERGIMLDGAGIGSSMACNKVKGIRAALCYSMKTILNSRQHNNANILTLGGPLHDKAELCVMVKTWLETKFQGGRHLERINKIMALEREGGIR